MPAQLPSKAVVEARARRSARASAQSNRTKWFIDEAMQNLNLSMKDRMRLATNYLRDKTVENISVPVVKGPKGKVLERSEPGEFPRADTTNLMKNIFAEVEEERPGIIVGYVGSPVMYGLVLEVSMDRSFLVRTMNEETTVVQKILGSSFTTTVSF